MDPATISLVLALVEQVIANEPAIAADMKTLFAGSNPTPAAWAALRASVMAETYGQFVPDTQLPNQGN